MELSKYILMQEHSPIENYNIYADRAEEAGKKVYHLNLGQPDIETPPEFMEAIHTYADKVLRYSPPEGRKELLEAACGYFRRFDVPAEPEDIIITFGGSDALTTTFSVILNEGDEVIIPEPFYTNYNLFIGLHGGKIVPIPTSPEDGYHYADREKFEAVLTDRTKAICICNPNNPTGLALSREEMEMLCDFAVENDLYIIADEVYREFAYDEEKGTSFGSIERAQQNVIVMDSVSKRFSACGARIGLIYTKNKEFLHNVTKITQARLSCGTLDQLGAAALYRLPENFFDGIKAEYRHRRDVAYEALCAIDGVVCRKPRGAFYISCKLPVPDTHDFLMWMLTEFSHENETVIFAPAAGFYATPGKGKDEIRLAYILNARDTARGIELIKLGLDQYKKEKLGQ